MKEDTKIVEAGRNPKAFKGAVNPPVYHVSTVLVDSVEDWQRRRDKDERTMIYGRAGTPTSYAFEDAVAELEGAAGCMSFPSGLAAIAGALLAFSKSGEHMLVTDSIYTPTRRLCDEVLTDFGVEVTYYDPMIGGAIGELMRDNTTVVFTESPGSLTFEVQDLPAIAAAAHEKGAKVLIDNTWASPLFFKPFDHGADVSIHAATKYLVGHSDAMLGAVTATAECFDRLRDVSRWLGQCAGPDDLYLGQRGIRTLGVRLREHQRRGIDLANWLKARPEVIRVMHPALPDDPGHELWKRDFTGASGLFGFVMESCTPEQLSAYMNGLEHFGMGASWGGYESLLIPTDPEESRTATEWNPGGQSMRVHAGLEDLDDLTADLERAFERLHAAARACAAES